MTDIRINPNLSGLRQAWASLNFHCRALMARTGIRFDTRRRPDARAPARARRPRPAGIVAKRGPVAGRALRFPVLRRLAIAGGAIALLLGISLGALYWRLTSGPLSLDLVTPLLTGAIEQRLGGHHRIEVGGTQLERDEDGRAALRLRDIIVRDPDGTVVASAPKAEVGLSGWRLLAGHWQAKSLNLIGAAMSLRIEPDGQLTIFAGADKRPLVTAPVALAAQSRGVAAAGPGTGAPAGPSAQDTFASLLHWMDSLDGDDGHDLSEIGLKSGNLVVDDRRSGKYLTFENINLSLTRPKEGGISFGINSSGADGPWSLTATVSPRADGRRAIEAVIRDVSPKDLLLALRMSAGGYEADMPISGVLRAEIGADGAAHMAEGRLVLGAGYIGDAGDPDTRMLIDEAQVNLRWDPARRQISMPIEISAGGNHTSLLGQIDAPRESGGPWDITIARGSISLSSAERIREPPLVLDRFAVRARVDPAQRRITLEQGEIGGATAALTLSGMLDYSGTEPRLVSGVSGSRMTVSALKRLWPVCISPPLRSWIIDHILGGTVERMTITTNAPLPTLKSSGPPVPDDGLSIEIVSSGTVVRPFGALPAIRDADLTARVNGRAATVRLGHGTADLPSGRKLAVSNATFEVPDTHPKQPPAKVRFRVEGGADAAAELIGLDMLREAATLQIDPATTHGTVAAQVSLAMPMVKELAKGMVNYTVDTDLTNLSVERLIRGYKVEASALRVSATPQAVQFKGDVRIAGTPTTIEFRKPTGDADAEVRLQTVLDDAARARFGHDLGGGLAGPLPVKLNGRMGSGDHESRFAVEVDLGQARIAEMLPGWNKPAGKPAKATFTYVDRGHGSRVEDLVIEGSGSLVRGTVDLDQDGDIALASFPVFGLSDGDKASLRAERGPDGVLKVVMRGDVYDGRGFVKGTMSGSVTDKSKQPMHDLDLDIKVGAMAGFNGEALRGLELRLSRRSGQIRSFALNCKLGRESTLIGDLRAYGNGRQVVYLETSDAGALFRFTDTYPRMYGGQLWVAMDPPNAEQSAQDGLLNIKEFTVRGEQVLERVAAAGAGEPGQPPSVAGNGVGFSRMRVEFTKSPGRFLIKDGVVWGPAVGATIEGQLDYAHDDVKMRGTFVPAYALNNFFSRVPVLGPLLGGGESEGMFGMTYEVAGTPHAPVLRVNPMSMIAPGIFRKMFEFRGIDDRTQQTPTR